MATFDDPRIDIPPFGFTVRAFMETYEKVYPYLEEGQEAQLSPAEVELAAAFHQADLSGFVQQAPIGPYRVDFYFPGVKLAVEVDGGKFHQDREAEVKRDDRLRDRGVRAILHLRALDVFINPRDCVGCVTDKIAFLGGPSDGVYKLQA